jgi:multisubunit Na+/H+ antiporter MnhB subunit
VTGLVLGLDGLLLVTLCWLAWRALAEPDLFTGVVLFVSFGLVMALVWVRLRAPDVALAEAALGAGITGALLLDAVGMMGHRARSAAPRGAGLAGLLVVAAGLALCVGVATLPARDPGLGPVVAVAMPFTGVRHDVTAVLLDFRGWDTLLEVSVLTVAALGAWGVMPRGPVQASPPSPVLDGLVRVAAPAAVLVAGYVLWAGSHRPGGAFQAGAVLAGLALLLVLAGRLVPPPAGATATRRLVGLGVAVFLLVAAGTLATGGRLLEYPRGYGGLLMLVIEAAATVSIAAILTTLFPRRQPRVERPS